ncbi:GDSL-type esterase/lipase family protein [uncultured Gimesia sp.]|uniref:GDSL-type esterase/lipase family protein n=1 Tax=uncultured Gimesia sp. TaxID=1678688 RepID=UPI00263830FB|nr:GDSL-type esterase/lipase family protein [uncultured Gimesia sp.]
MRRLLALCILLVLQQEVLFADEKIIDIGSRRELFVDRLIVEDLKNTTLKLHTPQLMPPVSPARPHGHYATVLKADDKFQFYYRGDTKAGNHWKKGWEQYHDGEVTLYSESKDAIHWIQPKLGIYKDHPTFPAGNVVLMNEFLVTHNFTPFIDTRSGVPAEQKYKALGGLAYQPNQHLEVKKRRGPGGLKAFVSPDGIHWKKLQEKPVIPEEWGKYFDSQNYAFWSENEQAYVCYFRRFIKGYRGIARTTSKDFINWTPLVEMHANLPNEHLYTPCTQPYFRAPHIYFALPTRFMVKRGAATDILFMSARGSAQFNREFTQSFIRPGIGSSGWANRANYAAIGIHQTGPAEMSFFLTGGRRYAMRLDGIASVNAPLEQGELTTKPLKFVGNELEINYSTSAAGQILVELQDEHGQPIPDFTIEDCEPIYGDHIARIVKWKNGSDLASLAGKPVKIRFAMEDADLFALKFNQQRRVSATDKPYNKFDWDILVDKNYAHLPGMSFVKEDPQLPRVLLIGDSISIGYTVTVRKQLAGKANVLRIPENAGQSSNGVQRLSHWLSHQKWDVIHFNWGLHDCFRNISLDQYKTNLKTIIKTLKSTDAKLIWANSTPIPENNPWEAVAGIEKKYNSAAKAIMLNNGIMINDLHSCIAPEFSKHNVKPGDVHLKSTGSILLGKQVSNQILACLTQK